MYKFKEGREHVDIILRRHGAIVTIANLDDRLGQLIETHYPEFFEANLEKVNGEKKTSLSQEKEVSSSILKYPRPEELISRQVQEKPALLLKESKPRRGRKKGTSKRQK